jgi:hypothetical protein
VLYLLQNALTPEPSPIANHHLVSATIRQRYEQTKERVAISDASLFNPTPREIDPFASVDALLLSAKNRLRRIGDTATFEARFDYPLAAVRDRDEFIGMLHFAQELGYGEVMGSSGLRLTPKGWRRLNELRVEGIESGSAFVVMSFADDLRSAFTNAIKPALEECGFTAIRTDLVEHNGKIDDRIVADIKRSAVVVADFSGHRQNVYFEAGFALGYGRPVIWSCREADIASAHFDTRQYNHIVWTSPEDLKQRLKNRIAATILP